MKGILLLTVFLGLWIGRIQSQDTLSHIVSGCVYGEKSTIDEESCSPGVFFNFANDTLYIHGTIGANCCGTHFAIVNTLRDTVFISTQDTGNLCTCVCLFCFELKVPARTTDTVICMNGIIYNTKGELNPVDRNNYDEVIKILPNPFDDEIRIIVDYQVSRSIIITDSSGKIIHNIDCSNQSEFLINTRSWHTGLYFINLETSDSTIFTRKVIKE